MATSPEATAASLAAIETSLLEAIGKNTTDTEGATTVDRTPRQASLSNRVEDYVRLRAFHHFMTSDSEHALLPPSQIAHFATDEEYLSGACMGLCQDLARYAVGRATVRDVTSVQETRDLVQLILDYLLMFDFRNGTLRRRYDGTKYVLKSLETLLYELSVTGAMGEDGEPPSKKRKENPLTPLSEQPEFEGIRKRMEKRDEMREQLIKNCRDAQKAAKQAIYALHRGDSKRAETLLGQCETCITNQLLPIVKEEPPLQSGSFANCLEEYVEAKLFHTWLGDGQSSNMGALLELGDFQFDLTPEQYLGGVCDLTGEIGRVAVHRGASRDFDGVRRCLETNSAVLTSLRTMERLPGAVNKKMDQVRKNVEKLERMTYEISLSLATGRNIQSEAMTPMEHSGDKEDDQ
eukprot:Nitzschia sp. Nitz4//scaffold11_size288233//181548//182765//NITZ4_000791-RA/size288233-processed-gene-0.242-mRNA-1//-1//CDS//3329534125//3852//frame0